jgi:polar amino acid transport system substrate-binding protein
MRRFSVIQGAVVVLCAVVALAAACSDSQDAASPTFVPRVEGELLVAAALPAPGFWDGESPEEVDAGFEFALARQFADEFGLELRIVDVPFERIAAGDLGGADLAIAQISVTDDREELVDFSLPYLTVDATVLAPAGSEVADLYEARGLRWVALTGSTQADLLDEVVRPDDDVLLVPTEVEAAAAVLSGDADAALVDAPSALLAAGADARLEAVARFATREHYGVALPDPAPSGNLEVVDLVLRRLAADGTLDDLVDDLADALGGDPDDLPVIRAR